MKYALLSFVFAWLLPTKNDRQTFRVLCKMADARKRCAILRKKYEKLVKVDEGVFPQGANKVVDEKIYKIGKYADDKYPVATVVGSMQSQPQSYLDIKGPVTADYQMYLEQEWIKSLRSKYPVKLNKKVLNTVKSN